MVLYVLTGLTDMLDGFIVRKAGTVSETGARLNTMIYCSAIGETAVFVCPSVDKGT